MLLRAVNRMRSKSFPMIDSISQGSPTEVDVIFDRIVRLEDFDGMAWQFYATAGSKGGPEQAASITQSDNFTFAVVMTGSIATVESCEIFENGGTTRPVIGYGVA